jgi:hypothetical protein
MLFRRLDRTSHEDPSVNRWQPGEQLRQTLREIQRMSAYATSSGIPIPSAAANALAELIKDLGSDYVDDDGAASASSSRTAEDAARLAARTGEALRVHGVLSALIAPATPQTLESNPKVNRFRDWLRYYPAVTSIAVVGFVSGLCLLFRFVPHMAPAEGLATLNLAGQLACLGAGALGSAFYSAFEASKYIVTRTYDSRYAGVYVFRFFLGIAAGMILANFGAALLRARPEAAPLGAATLALVGGYSADAVNRILLRVSETLSSFVRGSDEATVKAKDEELKATQTLLEAQRGRGDDDASSTIDDVLASDDGHRLADDHRKALERVKAHLQHRPA